MIRYLLISFLFLFGCESEVNEWEIKSFIEQCEQHGGIDRVDTMVVNVAICNDGYITNSHRENKG